MGEISKDESFYIENVLAESKDHDRKRSGSIDGLIYARRNLLCKKMHKTREETLADINGL